MRRNGRLLVVWVILAALTGSYLAIDHSGGGVPSAVLTSTVVLIALVKVRIIFREFMEVRHAPVLLCRLTDAWVVLMAVAMLGCYFAGAHLR